MGGVPGVQPATVLVLGGGTVGTHAAQMACGLGAKVYLLDTSLDRLRHLSEVMPKNCFPIMSSPATVRELVQEADVVIGAVLLHGAKAPKLVTREMLKTMKPGAVLVDVAIVQGGCFETSRVTNHNAPTFVQHGVVHYCVPNIASRVSRTASFALSNIFSPLLLDIGEKGSIEDVIRFKPGFKDGVYIYKGVLTNEVLGHVFDLNYQPIDLLLPRL